MSERTLIWVHGDCLNPNNPAFTQYPGAPAIFVWDDALLGDWQISLKRITFIYECLLELPVTIRRGDVAEQVAQFAQEHGATRIATTPSPSPKFVHIIDDINARLGWDDAIEVLNGEPFVKYDGYIDLKRFSRYWRTVKKYAMK